MKALNWHNLEKVSKNLSCQLIVVTVKFLDSTFFHLLNKSGTAIVFNLVVLKLKFLQRRALFHQNTNEFCPDIRNMVICQNDCL